MFKKICEVSKQLGEMCISQNLLKAKAEEAKKEVTLLRLEMDKIAQKNTALNEKVQLGTTHKNLT